MIEELLKQPSREGLTVAADLAASLPRSIRALKSDIEAFDLWCGHHHRTALSATSEFVADYLHARAENEGEAAVGDDQRAERSFPAKQR